MIKTLNDLLSLVALLITTFLCLRIFVGSLIQKNDETKDINENIFSRRKYLKDYVNNEEE